MKKIIAVVICLMSALLFVACGSSKDYSDYVAGKTFVYEKGGIFGDFTISIKDGRYVHLL